MTRVRHIGLWFSGLLAVVPAVGWAQPATQVSEATAPTIREQANDLIALMNGAPGISDQFHTSFLAEVPEAKLQALFATLTQQFGKANGIVSINVIDGNQAIIMVDYDRALVRAEMVIAGPSEQGKITGLHFTQTQMKNDAVGTVVRDIAALPGSSAFGMWRIEKDGRLTLISGHRANQSMATGSSFKLSILALLDEEIRQGKRRWNDVVPLTVKSLPSGQMQHWPDRSPVTLHSLATMMIAISDNSATDTLLALLGREKVVAFEKRHGIAAGRQYPMLSTIEAFVLKEDDQATLRAKWMTGSYAQRLALLESNKSLWKPANAGKVQTKGKPAYIEQIEWFYSPEDMARLLTWFARHGSADARKILGVSPGMSATDRKRWKEVGYKGGSEAGVIAMNYLLTAKNGAQFIVISSWNNPAKVVDEQLFYQLMQRANGLLAKP